MHKTIAYPIADCTVKTYETVKIELSNLSNKWHMPKNFGPYVPEMSVKWSEKSSNFSL